MSAVQYFQMACSIPACPDCGAEPDSETTTAASRVVHDDYCPLWRGAQAVRQDDALWFRAFPYMHCRVRPMHPAERAEALWLGQGWIGPDEPYGPLQLPARPAHLAIVPPAGFLVLVQRGDGVWLRTVVTGPS